MRDNAQLVPVIDFSSGQVAHGQWDVDAFHE